MVRAISFTILATISGQVLNFFTDILIADYFGTSWRADSFMMALLLPVIIYELFINGISATFVPLYANRRKHGDEKIFFSAVFSSVGLGTILVSAILFLSAPYLVKLIAGGFSAEARDLTVNLTRLLLFLVVSMPLSAVLSNLLNANNMFAIPALGKAVNFACVILTAVLLVKPMGIYSLVTGYFIGGLVFFAIQIYLVRGSGIKYVPGSGLAHPALKEMGLLLLPLLMASLVNYVNMFVVLSVAASFAEGSIAALNYAFEVISIPSNMFVLAAMTVVLPTFSRQAAEGDLNGLKQLTLKGIRFISFIIFPFILGMIIFREPLIRLLFERGKFTAGSTAVTSSALLFYVCGTFGLAVVTLLTRVFYAIKDIKTLSRINIFTIIINIVLILLLSKTVGFTGIPLTFSITSSVQMLIMMALLEKKHGFCIARPLFKSSL
ncbi:MAG TPA: murein biosynthesis integral membrane protein MurJ, partial [Dissulfurispiraceae bacterium]|nr:murein biosynthesis integral membrane protein MurJ [Dissulfurispiraceae bacterium]